MSAEIIAIGSELTNGSKLDTNSQWLSVELAGVGIETRFHTSVGDELDLLVDAFRAASRRSDLVVITGGLGPTLDDLTREALAKFAGVEMQLHEPSLEHIEQMFARRGRRMPERNCTQAMFPAGAEPLPNPRGTAPGIWFETAETRFAALPGVPSELKPMFHREVLPRLGTGGHVMLRARVNCFGLGESAIEEKLGDLTARGRDPEVGITAHDATITLRILAAGKTRDECERKIAATKDVIRDRLGPLVFGEEDEELEHVVLRILSQRDATLAVAEIGTGGLLAHCLTNVAGYEKQFAGGVVACSADVLQKMYGLSQQLAAVSETFTAEIARRALDRFGADFAIAVGEQPPFDPESESDPPTTFVALAGANFCEVRPHTPVGDPAIQKSRAAKTALNLLRLHLLGRLRTHG